MAGIVNLAVNGSVAFVFVAVGLLVALLVLPRKVSDRLLANRFLRKFVEGVGNVDLSRRGGGAPGA
jgi:hypothetical protein